MNDQNPSVEPASDEDSYDFLLQDDIQPEGMDEIAIYKATITRSYVESGANNCPHCGSKDIELLPGGWSSDDNWVDNSALCYACKTSWVEVYILSYITDILLPEEKSYVSP